MANVAARCRDDLGDKADALSALWRQKQLEYTRDDLIVVRGVRTLEKIEIKLKVLQDIVMFHERCPETYLYFPKFYQFWKI